MTEGEHKNFPTARWTSPAGRRELRRLFKTPIGLDGPTVFGAGDMKELLDALEIAEGKLGAKWCPTCGETLKSQPTRKKPKRKPAESHKETDGVLLVNNDTPGEPYG